MADSVATAFGPASPGLLRVDAGYPLVRALCGDPLDEPAELWVDNGFGCLADGQKGTEETHTAWIEAMPSSWDAAGLCAAPVGDPEWRGLVPGLEITGSEEDLDVQLQPSPLEGDPQGEGTGTWRRDLSPCGGSIEVEITVQ